MTPTQPELGRMPGTATLLDPLPWLQGRAGVMGAHRQLVPRSRAGDRSGAPAAGRCRAAHARAAGNQRLLARGAAHLGHASGRYLAHASRVGAPLLLPTATASVMSPWSMWQELWAGIIASSRNEEAEDLDDIARPRGLLRGRLLVAGRLQQSLHRAGRCAASVYRRRAARATAGLPSRVAKQVTRPVRNREAPATQPHLGWLPHRGPSPKGGKT
jgi:hypothetical protein